MILVGHDQALPIRATAQPLTREQELAEILAGRHTYDLHPLGMPRKPFLVYRDSFRIAGTREWKVVADHHCPPGAVAPAFRSPPIPLVLPYGQPIPDEPPF
ncbi:hypothetical protein Pve01_66710 [Planomonospora venezuelensis]|nr:hypothetical protein Pve01_66710 [Planomonospora venezuelensis]